MREFRSFCESFAQAHSSCCQWEKKHLSLERPRWSILLLCQGSSMTAASSIPTPSTAAHSSQHRQHSLEQFRLCSSARNHGKSPTAPDSAAQVRSLTHICFQEIPTTSIPFLEPMAIPLLLKRNVTQSALIPAHSKRKYCGFMDFQNCNLNTSRRPS